MMKEIEQTHDEKVAMYMKLTKREIAEMLANCNELIEARSPQWSLEPGLFAYREGLAVSLMTTQTVPTGR